MIPGARLQAAIEVLDLIRTSRAPADGVLKAWGREHRFAGSGDRRGIAERVYTILRARVRLTFLMQGEEGRLLLLGALKHLDGLGLEEIEAICTGGHCPAPLTDTERARLTAEPGDMPDWVAAGAPQFIAEAFQDQYGEAWRDEARALIEPRAPVDLRVNSLCAGIENGVEGALRLMALEKFEADRTLWSNFGLRMPPAAAPDVQKLRAYSSGWIEVQDEASQIAGFLAGAKPGQTVVDYCAGGGGKTLIFAQTMRGPGQTVQGPNGGGRLIACDVNRKRLDVIPERLTRAGANAEIRQTREDGHGVQDLEGKADLVFVDAPCSGAGTWRRHPEGAWRLSAASIGRLADLQLEILTRAARLVKPGGRLAYATCSVLDQENAQVADAFAAAHPEFEPLPICEAAKTPYLTDAAREKLNQIADGHRLQLTPHRSGTDGFYLALYTRRPN
jgi:16S rRNA (cytosine967-C5)-methyltransferase